MVKRRGRGRYGRRLRAAPVVMVVIGGAVSGCHSQTKNHVFGVVPMTGSISTTPPHRMVNGVVAVTTTIPKPVVGVTPLSSSGSRVP